MTALVRMSPKRQAVRIASWWGRAVIRAIEELAYDGPQLIAARALARSGRLGGILLEAGSVTAGVEDNAGLHTTRLSLPVLDATSRDAFAEVVAQRPGAVQELFEGRLSHELVEYAEEAGVEFVPYGAEFAATCSCDSWHDACTHAVALGHQLCWLLDADPLLLLQLRGVGRGDLAAPSADPDPQDESGDEQLALDAALEAQRLLEALGEGSH